MLVLARRPDESVMIGKNIKITVIDIRGGKVRLGIAAPRDLAVHRQEIFDLIQRQEQPDPPPNAA